MTIKLPDQFKGLEAVAQQWALAKEHERSRKRYTSSMEDIEQFYHAVFPHMEAILEYLDKYLVEELPPEGRNLFNLAMSLTEVAPSVEVYKTPEVIGGYDPARLICWQDDPKNSYFAK